MSVRIFTASKTASQATILTPELNKAGFRTFVVYDTSTGSAEAADIPDNLACTQNYYRWRTSTGAFDSGLGAYPINITNRQFYPLQQNTALDYTRMKDENLHVLTYDEFNIVQQLARRVDMVNRRFPNSFEKKFSYGELLSFIHQATIEVDVHPPATKFWYMFTNVTDEGAANQSQPLNPFMMTTGNGLRVPFEWHSIIIEGALLLALIEQGILEVDVNFSYSDQGITVQYNNFQPLQSMYQMLIEKWTEKKHLLKMNYFRPMGIGTMDFASGLVGAVSNMLGDAGASSWWARGTGTRV